MARLGLGSHQRQHECIVAVRTKRMKRPQQRVKAFLPLVCSDAKDERVASEPGLIVAAGSRAFISYSMSTPLWIVVIRCRTRGSKRNIESLRASEQPSKPSIRVAKEQSPRSARKSGRRQHLRDVASVKRQDDA